MKKIVLSIVFAVSAYSINVKAQVGINVVSPSSTLDVTAKNATGTSKNVDGLLVPRVDRERAQNMASVPTSTIIFVNSIATGTQTGTAVNIDAVGHYSFDGTAWVKLGTGSGSGVNIYNSDGTLTGNRTVTQGANTLAFNGTATNAFSVDGTTLSVDAANNSVGLGTTTPAEKLDVRGGLTFSGQSAVNKTAFGGLDNTTGGTVPSQTRILSWGPDASTSGIISFWTGLGGAPTTEKMRVHSNGNVGIGTTAPTAKLDIAGNIKIADGSQGTDKILASDANGLATWKTGPFTADVNTFGTPYMSAEGGTGISYNNGAGWANNVLTDLPLNEISDLNNVYNPTTGIITINTEGVYYIRGLIRLSNDLGTPTTPFDGNSGIFFGNILIKPSGDSSFVNVLGQNANVLRGVTINGGNVTYDLTMSGMLHLNVGDQVKLQFATYGTATMNNDQGNIIINRSKSFIKLFKF